MNSKWRLIYQLVLRAQIGTTRFMWYDAGDYDKLDGQKTKYRVIPVGTGHYWKKNGDKDIVSKENYIGTALLEGGTLVLHYFLVKAEDYFK